MRTFAPHRLGRYECDAWVSYYRHEWSRFFPASVGMVREGFGMSQLHTLQGAYLVLRANHGKSIKQLDSRFVNFVLRAGHLSGQHKRRSGVGDRYPS